MSPAAPCGELELPRHPSASGQARAFVAERFGDQLTPAAAYDVSLVVTELVSNAVVHGSGQITLRASKLGGAVRLEVIDEGDGKSDEIRAQSPSGTSTDGRGLQIVEALSSRWGAREGSTHVWAEIPTA